MSYGSCPTQSASISEEYTEHPEEDVDESIKYRDSESDYSDGVKNHAYRYSNGTPVNGVFGSGDDLGNISDDEHIVVTSIKPGPSCDTLSDVCPEQEAPLRFSTAVQTITPSTIATLRKNDMYIASLRIRSVSLV